MKWFYQVRAEIGWKRLITSRTNQNTIYLKRTATPTQNRPAIQPNTVDKIQPNGIWNNLPSQNSWSARSVSWGSNHSVIFLKFHRNSVQTDDIPGSGSLYSFWKTFHIVVLHMVPYVTKIHVFAVFKVVRHVWSLNSSIFKAFRRTLNLWDKCSYFRTRTAVKKIEDQMYNQKCKSFQWIATGCCARCFEKVQQHVPASTSQIVILIPR